MTTTTTRELVELIEKLLIRQQLNLWEFTYSDEDLSQLMIDLKVKRIDLKNVSEMQTNYQTMGNGQANLTQIIEEKSDHYIHLIETTINNQNLKLFELIESKIELRNQIEEFKEHRGLVGSSALKCESDRNVDQEANNWIKNEMVHIVLEVDPSISDSPAKHRRRKLRRREDKLQTNSVKRRETAVELDSPPPYFCTICGQRASSRSNLYKHMHLHSGDKKFRCEECGKQFIRSDYLFSHKKRCHSNAEKVKLKDPRTYYCNVCGQRASSISNLSKHMLLHTNKANKTKFDCDECAKQFVRNDYLVAHKKRCHNKRDKSKYPCVDCAKVFRSALGLQNHVLNHDSTAKTFKCHECDSLFRNLDNLQDHINRHTGAKPYSCDICAANFSARLLIKRHMAIHSGLQANLCNVCGKTFKRLKDLKYHMFRHTNDSRYQCTECKKNFFSRFYLQKHMVVHTGVKAYTCQICGYKCSTQHRLNVHIRTHGPKIQMPCPRCGTIFENKKSLEKHLLKHDMDVAPLQVEKTFECGECPRKFHAKINLNKHVEKIHGEDSKRFTCQICKATLASAKGLRSHQNTHTKPYRCQYCDKSFGHSGNLNSHLMTHTGEKPHCCNICGKAFRTISTMVTHRRVHAREKPA